MLEIRSTTSVLSVAMTGQGVSPVIKTSVPDGTLDVGNVLVGESATQVFTVNDFNF